MRERRARTMNRSRHTQMPTPNNRETIYGE